jgi:hypothetical protein
VVPTRANGQPAFGLYLADPHASVYRAYSLLVITTAGDHITAITGFNTNVMTRFGLPRTLPELALSRRHVDKSAVMALERNGNRHGRAVPVLGHDQVRLTGPR